MFESFLNVRDNSTRLNLNIEGTFSAASIVKRLGELYKHNNFYVAPFALRARRGNNEKASRGLSNFSAQS
jgi:hypothetical protein